MKRIQRYRQELHKRAELDMHLPKTISYLKEQLKGLPCEIIEVIPSSLCVYFNANKEYTVAFRSDMDALPIEEDESHTIVSMQKGVMHACGHDGIVTTGMHDSGIFRCVRQSGLFLYRKCIHLCAKHDFFFAGKSCLILTGMLRNDPRRLHNPKPIA